MESCCCSALHRALFLTSLAVLHCGRIHNSSGGWISEVTAQSKRNLHCCCVHCFLPDRAVQYYSGMFWRRMWSYVWHATSVLFPPAPSRDPCEPLKGQGSITDTTWRLQAADTPLEVPNACSPWLQGGLLHGSGPRKIHISTVHLTSGSLGCSPLLPVTYEIVKFREMIEFLKRKKGVKWNQTSSLNSGRNLVFVSIDLKHCMALTW